MLSHPISVKHSQNHHHKTVHASLKLNTQSGPNISKRKMKPLRTLNGRSSSISLSKNRNMGAIHRNHMSLLSKKNSSKRSPKFHQASTSTFRNLKVKIKQPPKIDTLKIKSILTHRNKLQQNLQPLSGNHDIFQKKSHNGTVSGSKSNFYSSKYSHPKNGLTKTLSLPKIGMKKSVLRPLLPSFKPRFGNKPYHPSKLARRKLKERKKLNKLIKISCFNNSSHTNYDGNYSSNKNNYSTTHLYDNEGGSSVVNESTLFGNRSQPSHPFQIQQDNEGQIEGLDLNPETNEMLSKYKYLNKSQNYSLLDMAADEKEDSFLKTTKPTSKLSEYIDMFEGDFSSLNIQQHFHEACFVLQQEFKALEKTQLLGEVLVMGLTVLEVSKQFPSQFVFEAMVSNIVQIVTKRLNNKVKLAIDGSMQSDQEFGILLFRTLKMLKPFYETKCISGELARYCIQMMDAISKNTNLRKFWDKKIEDMDGQNQDQIPPRGRPRSNSQGEPLNIDILALKISDFSSKKKRKFSSIKSNFEDLILYPFIFYAVEMQNVFTPVTSDSLDSSPTHSQNIYSYQDQVQNLPPKITPKPSSENLTAQLSIETLINSSYLSDISLGQETHITNLKSLFYCLFDIILSQNVLHQCRLPLNKKLYLLCLNILFGLFSESVSKGCLIDLLGEDYFSHLYKVIDSFFRTITSLSSLLGLEINFGGTLLNLFGLVPRMLQSHPLLEDGEDQMLKKKAMKKMKREIVVQLALLGHELLQASNPRNYDAYHISCIRAVAGAVSGVITGEDQPREKKTMHNEVRSFFGMIHEFANHKSCSKEFQSLFEEVNIDIVHFLRHNLD